MAVQTKLILWHPNFQTPKGLPNLLLLGISRFFAVLLSLILAVLILTASIKSVAIQSDLTTLRGLNKIILREAPAYEAAIKQRKELDASLNWFNAFKMGVGNNLYPVPLLTTLAQTKPEKINSVSITLQKAPDTQELRKRSESPQPCVVNLTLLANIDGLEEQKALQLINEWKQTLLTLPLQEGAKWLSVKEKDVIRHAQIASGFAARGAPKASIPAGKETIAFTIVGQFQL